MQNCITYIASNLRKYGGIPSKRLIPSNIYRLIIITETFIERFLLKGVSKRLIHFEYVKIVLCFSHEEGIYLEPVELVCYLKSLLVISRLIPMLALNISHPFTTLSFCIHKIKWLKYNASFRDECLQNMCEMCRPRKGKDQMAFNWGCI